MKAAWVLVVAAVAGCSKPTPPTAPAALQNGWWCFQGMGGMVGACEEEQTACAERLAAMSDGMTRFQSTCAPQASAFCFPMVQGDPAIEADSRICYPTAEICAATRQELASSVATIGPECVATWEP